MKISRLVIGIVAIFSTSCAVQSKKLPVTTTTLFEILTEQQDGGGNIKFVEIISEPGEILMLQGDEHLHGKIAKEDLVYANYVLVNMGEQPTGGYKIKVTNVEETPTNIILTIEETAPNPDAMVSQSVTYPYTVLKINSKKEIIIK